VAFLGKTLNITPILFGKGAEAAGGQDAQF